MGSGGETEIRLVVRKCYVVVLFWGFLSFLTWLVFLTLHFRQIIFSRLVFFLFLAAPPFHFEMLWKLKTSKTTANTISRDFVL